jgi:hypothetical protein
MIIGIRTPQLMSEILGLIRRQILRHD